MIASIDGRGNPTFTAPAGWTLIRLDILGFTQRKATYYKVATASEPASYTWTWSPAQAAAGGILAYSGADQAAPVDVHAGSVSSAATSASIVAPSITTTGDGAMIIGFFDIAQNTTIAPPAGMIEQFEALSSAGPYPIVCEAADLPQSTPGATGDRTALAGKTGWSIGQLIALRRAPPP